jgi:hypothetical protein
MDLIENYNNKQMPIYAAELVHGAELIKNSRNNNKYENLMIL